MSSRSFRKEERFVSDLRFLPPLPSLHLTHSSLNLPINPHHPTHLLTLPFPLHHSPPHLLLNSQTQPKPTLPLPPTHPSSPPTTGSRSDAPDTSTPSPSRTPRRPPSSSSPSPPASRSRRSERTELPRRSKSTPLFCNGDSGSVYWRWMVGRTEVMRMNVSD